jgi:cytochrome c oxidase subunit 2
VRPIRVAGSLQETRPGETGNVRKKALWVLGLLALALLLAACAPHATQDPLKPAGPTARAEKNLFVPVFWVAVAVFVIVQGAILFIVIRYRHRKGHDRMPRQTHGNTRLEIGWTIVPALVLAVVMVPTVSLIWDLAKPPSPDALHVTVEGYQWWWGFQYTDTDMTVGYGDKGPVTVADVLVIPAGRQVYLTLESKGGLIGGTPYQRDYEVIHSFWVPQLFGKQDVVPNRENHITFSADEPGTYTGQCAEFCGLEHARMKVRVVALDAQAWDAWVANQKLPSVEPSGGQASAGMTLFLGQLPRGGSCTTCHSIGGTEATSPAAPNLTHFAADEHPCFAGCDWETSDVEALKAWLRDPNAVKLGAKMPNYHLTEDEIDSLVAYLETLK